MVGSLDYEFNYIATQLTLLFKEELKKQGLVETGKLVNSIKWKAKKTTKGYELTMESLEYFKYLDKTYTITQNVLKSSKYLELKKRISAAYAEYTLNEIKKI